jgi:hypothetical protein
MTQIEGRTVSKITAAFGQAGITTLTDLLEPGTTATLRCTVKVGAKMNVTFLDDEECEVQETLVMSGITLSNIEKAQQPRLAEGEQKPFEPVAHDGNVTVMPGRKKSTGVAKARRRPRRV